MTDTEEMKANVANRKSLRTRLGRFIVNNLLIVFLLLSLILGIGLGAGLRTVDPPMTSRSIMYLRFPGDLLMNMLTFLIVPLIISSLISGLSSLDTRASGKMGLMAIFYYLATTFTAVVLGIILSVSIQPGTRGGDPDDLPTDGEDRVVNTADTFLDLIRQCFPNNIVEMCFKKSLTKQVLQDNDSALTTSAVTMTTVAMTTININTSELEGPRLPKVGVRQEPEKIYEPVLVKEDGMNVLGMVVFSIFLGVILGRMGDRGKPLIDLFDSICEATMQLVKLAIWYSPIGIMCLIAAKVVEMEDPAKSFEQLAFYVLTVMTGLVLHGFVTLPLIYLVIVRRNPFAYLYGVAEALVTALATGSSSATMPVTMRCLEEKNRVDSRIVKFVIPVGATINMDGTALYEAVAVLFIGQMRGFDMDIGRIITISITATAAAIGAAGVPQAGLVTMVIVLSAVGFPTEDVALILAVDWLLDRFRTAINVLGDAFGAGIVHHLSTADLQKLDLKHTTDSAAIDCTHGTDSQREQTDSVVGLAAIERGFQRESSTLLNDNTRFKNYNGIRNDGFAEGESDM